NPRTRAPSSGALPILPRGVYAALATGAAAAGAWVATRRGGPSPALAIALPLAALLLAWRALLSYVAFLPVLALVAGERGGDRQPKADG
ncbi:MAG: hypothetical protein AAB284_05115, partial [Chloroflexota bacterium]